MRMSDVSSCRCCINSSTPRRVPAPPNAVRWAKLNAHALKTRAELVGLAGQSSGGHLGMLVAMRPRDARYLAIPLPAGSSAGDPSAGRFQRAGCDSGLRPDVMAGDQSAEPV